MDSVISTAYSKLNITLWTGQHVEIKLRFRGYQCPQNSSVLQVVLHQARPHGHPEADRGTKRGRSVPGPHLVQ